MSASGSNARLGPGSWRTTIDDVLANFSVAQVRLWSILVGGAAGTLARAGVGEALPHTSGKWPWATFVVNLVGSLFLGWLLTRLAERVAPTTYWRPLLGTGFSGSLTTFSAFQVETFELMRTGHAGLGVAYAVTSVAAGMALAVVGVMVARWGRHW